MATSTATEKVVNFGEVTAAKERKQGIMDRQLPNFEDCRRKVQVHKSKRHIEQQLDNIAVNIIAVFSFFMSGLSEFFGMWIIYKTIHPTTLDEFLFAGIILCFCLITIYGCIYSFVKKRIYQKLQSVFDEK